MDSPLSRLFHLLPAVLAVAALNLCHGSDTLYAGHSLTGNQTIVSKNGTFELGFFQPPGSRKWYIGVWFGQISEQSVVWVANRENPVDNIAGLFTLTRAGNLALFDDGGASVWTGQGTDIGSRATLLENGNFVVFNGTGGAVWESSRELGNTLLPGMKIGIGQKLTSWKSSSDPAPGSFSLELDPSGPGKFVLVWKESIQYWDSGPWNGQFFSRLPEMATKYVYLFSFVNNRTDTFFTYSLTPGARLITRFVIDQVGDVRLYTWIDGNNWNMFWSQPQDQCEIYDFCGSFGICRHSDNLRFCNCLQGFEPRDGPAWESEDWSDGCARKTPLNCNGYVKSSDGFLEMQGEVFGDYSSENRTVEDCESACMGNCSCVAYSYTDSKSCRMWAGDLLTLTDGADNGKNETVFVRLAEADLPQTFKHHDRRLIETLVAVSGCLAVVGVVFLVGFLCWKSGPEKYKDNVPGSLRMFTYRELQFATRSFSERLGGGGFGSVYKGVLPDETHVAVKVLEGSSQGEKQFRMEVSTIGTIQHVNLVRLRGFCTEGTNRMLVYDYMPNGSLNSLLFPKPIKPHPNILDWNTRYEIALGTARGILYLHEKCRDCIIHCDIKPENILLDADLIPKVADFGLAKLVGRDFTHVLTTMRGTRGYLAPEWISGTPITAKADVYSFGMTLLEIISGRRNLDFSATSSTMFYPTWAGNQMKLGNMTDLLDAKLNGNADVEQLRRAALVGGWCIQDDEDARPTMAHVVNVLEGIVDIFDVPPIPRSLQLMMEQGEGGGAAQCDFLFSEKALMMKKHLYKETPAHAV